MSNIQFTVAVVRAANGTPCVIVADKSMGKSGKDKARTLAAHLACNDFTEYYDYCFVDVDIQPGALYGPVSAPAVVDNPGEVVSAVIACSGEQAMVRTLDGCVPPELEMEEILNLVSANLDPSAIAALQLEVHLPLHSRGAHHSIVVTPQTVPALITAASPTP
jgi:hypothetical protein